MKNALKNQGRFFDTGTPYVWASGISVVILIVMLLGLILLIVAKGGGYFWPSNIARFEMEDGSMYMGRVMGHDIDRMSAGKTDKRAGRTLLKIGNRDFYDLDFKWVNDFKIKVSDWPEYVAVVEREEYGDFIGFIRYFSFPDGKVDFIGGDSVNALDEAFLQASSLKGELEDLEGSAFKVRSVLSGIETKIQQLSYHAGSITPEEEAELEKLKKRRDDRLKEISVRLLPIQKRISEIEGELRGYSIAFEDVNGRQKKLDMKDAVKFYFPNSMTIPSKIARYIGKICEFLVDWPRESNTEGGIFPAIYGTALMVLIMTLIAAPFGALTAVYMHEYAKPGPLLNLVRLAVNNLAGVPSIVFGIFGLGFFIYFVGGGIDSLFFSDKLPTPTFGTGGILWASITLALLTVPVVVVATEEGLAAVPKANREGSLALGASKFQTLLYVALPNAMPGILTGIILAISRGAGEVAPLMITGVVKLASSLPVDGEWPFFHLERKFMHLGFHIYDVGFQSPNVEAAKPMVYNTTLLLLAMVITLNLGAIFLRNRIKKKYEGSAV